MGRRRRYYEDDRTKKKRARGRRTLRDEETSTDSDDYVRRRKRKRRVESESTSPSPSPSSGRTKGKRLLDASTSEGSGDEINPKNRFGGLTVSAATTYYRSNFKAAIKDLQGIKYKDIHIAAMMKNPLWFLFNALYKCKSKEMNKRVNKFEVDVRKIIKTFNQDDNTFMIAQHSVPLTSMDVQLILGINGGDRKIPLKMSNYEKPSWITDLFKEEIANSKSYLLCKKPLREKIKDVLRKEDSEGVDDVVRLTHLYLLASLLAPQQNASVSWHVTIFLSDVDRVIEYDWSGYIVDVLINQIRESHTLKAGGCAMLLPFWLCEHTFLVDPIDLSAYPRFLKWDLRDLNERMIGVNLRRMEDDYIRRLELRPNSDEKEAVHDLFERVRLQSKNSESTPTNEKADGRVFEAETALALNLRRMKDDSIQRLEFRTNSEEKENVSDLFEGDQLHTEERVSTPTQEDANGSVFGSETAVSLNEEITNQDTSDRNSSGTVVDDPIPDMATDTYTGCLSAGAVGSKDGRNTNGIVSGIVQDIMNTYEGGLSYSPSYRLDVSRKHRCVEAVTQAREHFSSISGKCLEGEPSRRNEGLEKEREILVKELADCRALLGLRDGEIDDLKNEIGSIKRKAAQNEHELKESMLNYFEEKLKQQLVEMNAEHDAEMKKKDDELISLRESNRDVQTPDECVGVDNVSTTQIIEHTANLQLVQAWAELHVERVENEKLRAEINRLKIEMKGKLTVKASGVGQPDEMTPVNITQDAANEISNTAGMEGFKMQGIGSISPVGVTFNDERTPQNNVGVGMNERTPQNNVGVGMNAKHEPSSMVQRLKIRTMNNDRKPVELTPAPDTAEIIALEDGSEPDSPAEECTAELRFNEQQPAMSLTSGYIRHIIKECWSTGGPNFLCWKASKEKGGHAVYLRDMLDVLHHKRISSCVVDAWAAILLVLYEKRPRAAYTKIFSAFSWRLLASVKKTKSDNVVKLIDDRLDEVQPNDVLVFPLWTKGQGRTARDTSEHWTMLKLDLRTADWRFYNSWRPRLETSEDVHLTRAAVVVDYVNTRIRERFAKQYPGHKILKGPAKRALTGACMRQEDDSVDCGVVMCSNIEAAVLDRQTRGGTFNEKLSAKYRKQMVEWFMNPLEAEV